MEDLECPLDCLEFAVPSWSQLEIPSIKTCLHALYGNASKIIGD
jgi:hypothetical protein